MEQGVTIGKKLQFLAKAKQLNIARKIIRKNTFSLQQDNDPMKSLIALGTNFPY
jgi:hypothetical protein